MRNIYQIVGLGYGDEGKGSIVDYLARKTNTSLVVRYNGGAQAAHNVLTPEGYHHTFAQFGSGTFTPGSATYLSKYMLVNPLNLYTEGKHLIELGVPDIWERLFIDEEATIITPWHVAANRAREKARGDARHGSCGQGIGETVADSLAGTKILAKELRLKPDRLKAKLRAIRDYKNSQLYAELGHGLPSQGTEQDEENYLDRVVSLYMALPETAHIISEPEVETLFEKPDQIIFEGAQGLLLDQDYGWHPHTTWSKTTLANAEQLMLDYGCTGDEVTRIGVTRAYSTRHGAGPLPTENNQPGFETHNRNDKWQGAFRIGAFDAMTFDYALAVQPVDQLALTCVDQVGLGKQFVCAGYNIDTGYNEYEITIKRIEYQEEATLNRQQTITEMLYNALPEYAAFSKLEDFINWMNAIVPIGITSYGPTADEKMESEQGALVS